MSRRGERRGARMTTTTMRPGVGNAPRSRRRGALWLLASTAIPLLSACAAEAPPLEALELRDALTAEPDVIASMPEAARREPAERRSLRARGPLPGPPRFGSLRDWPRDARIPQLGRHPLRARRPHPARVRRRPTLRDLDAARRRLQLDRLRFTLFSRHERLERASSWASSSRSAPGSRSACRPSASTFSPRVRLAS